MASSEDLCDLIRNCGTSNIDSFDIDQYVARYRQSGQQQFQLQTSNGSSLSLAMTPALAGGGVGGISAAVVQNAASTTGSTATTPEVHKRGKKKQLKKHFWNWNDSLKSNSDKFLESLEYDAMNVNGGGGGGGSKSNSLKKYRKITNCSNIEGI